MSKLPTAKNALLVARSQRAKKVEAEMEMFIGIVNKAISEGETWAKFQETRLYTENLKALKEAKYIVSCSRTDTGYEGTISWLNADQA